MKMVIEKDKNFRNVPQNRKGSQLAISLFCDIFNGIHPVEALLSANLDIIPRFRS